MNRNASKLYKMIQCRTYTLNKQKSNLMDITQYVKLNNHFLRHMLLKESFWFPDLYVGSNFI